MCACGHEVTTNRPPDCKILACPTCKIEYLKTSKAITVVHPEKMPTEEELTDEELREWLREHYAHERSPRYA